MFLWCRYAAVMLRGRQYTLKQTKKTPFPSYIYPVAYGYFVLKNCVWSPPAMNLAAVCCCWTWDRMYHRSSAAYNEPGTHLQVIKFLEKMCCRESCLRAFSPRRRPGVGLQSHCAGGAADELLLAPVQRCSAGDVAMCKRACRAPRLQSTEWAKPCCVKARIPVNSKSSHVSAALLFKKKKKYLGMLAKLRISTGIARCCSLPSFLPRKLHVDWAKYSWFHVGYKECVIWFWSWKKNAERSRCSLPNKNRRKASLSRCCLPAGAAQPPPISLGACAAAVLGRGWVAPLRLRAPAVPWPCPSGSILSAAGRWLTKWRRPAPCRAWARGESR